MRSRANWCLLSVAGLLAIMLWLVDRPDAAGRASATSTASTLTPDDHASYSSTDLDDLDHALLVEDDDPQARTNRGDRATR